MDGARPRGCVALGDLEGLKLDTPPHRREQQLPRFPDSQGRSLGAADFAVGGGVSLIPVMLLWVGGALLQRIGSRLVRRASGVQAGGAENVLRVGAFSSSVI